MCPEVRKGRGEVMDGWISVEDRLPEPHFEGCTCSIDVLFFPPLTHGSYIFADKKWQDKYEGFWYEDITHWQPVPKPPNVRQAAK